MQFIIPHERIRALPPILIRTDCTVQVTMMVERRHVRRGTPVEVRRRIIVNIAHELPHVEQRKFCPGISLCDEDLERRLVLVHVVDRGDVFVHHVCNLGLVGRHVGPVVVRPDAVDGVVGIEGRQVEGRDVQEHKGPPAGGVDGVEGREDAVRVIGQYFAGDLRVGEEGVDANVVGACMKMGGLVLVLGNGGGYV